MYTINKLCCVVLCCAVLCCIVLSCLNLSCPVLSCLILSYLILCYVMSCHVMSSHAIPCHVMLWHNHASHSMTQRDPLGHSVVQSYLRRYILRICLPEEWLNRLCSNFTIRRIFTSPNFSKLFYSHMNIVFWYNKKFKFFWCALHFIIDENSPWASIQCQRCDLMLTYWRLSPVNV